MKRESNQIDRSPDDLHAYPHLDERAVVFRWHKGWFDGPLNGSISHEGTRYWFDFYCDTEEPGCPSYFRVFPLTEQEADFADAWSTENKRFQAEWQDQRTKDLAATEAVEVKWKEHEARLPSYSEREPVGWFIDGANSAFYGIQVFKAQSADEPPPG
jgi:hypothetical protein